MHVNRQPNRRGGGTTHHRIIGLIRTRSRGTHYSIHGPQTAHHLTDARMQVFEASAHAHYDISHSKGIDAPSTGQTWALERDFWSSFPEPRHEGSVD